MKYGHCWLCGRYGYLEEHHIFGGADRNKSTRYKLIVLLCGERCHRTGPRAVHQCAETAQLLHEFGQRKFMEENNATVADFRRLFGKNYLDLDDVGEKELCDPKAF